MILDRRGEGGVGGDTDGGGGGGGRGRERQRQSLTDTNLTIRAFSLPQVSLYVLWQKHRYTASLWPDSRIANANEGSRLSKHHLASLNKMRYPTHWSRHTPSRWQSIWLGATEADFVQNALADTSRFLGSFASGWMDGLTSLLQAVNRARDTTA